jgi:large subunit ribosomal protein L7e
MSFCSLRLDRKTAKAAPAKKEAVAKVPETILKTTKVREAQREHAAKAAAENVKVSLIFWSFSLLTVLQRLKAKREVIFRRAEKYVSQYRKISSDKVRAQKLAKTRGQVYVPAEAKVLFVVRIRGYVFLIASISLLI